MKAEKPANGIMKTSERPQSQSFRIACDCHSESHAVDMWIEVDGDPREPQQVQLEFFVNMSVPFWSRGFNRLRAAWNALCMGNVTHAHTMLLNKQAALNLSEAIRQTIQQLEKKA